MKGQWRQLAARPIRDRDRLRAFWVCVAVLVGAAGLLFSLPDREPPPLSKEPGPILEFGSGAPSPPSIAATAGVPRGAERAARRFVADYLAWAYGRRGSAATIRSAAPSLAARLGKERLPVPPAARTRAPELTHLESHRLAGADLVAVTARIGVGSVTYAIDLAVARDGWGRWLVTRVGAE